MNDHARAASQTHNYPAGPACLAVRFGSSEPSDVSIIWKGGVSLDVLRKFFGSSAAEIANRTPYCRGWIVNKEGQRSFEVSGSVVLPKGGLNGATFLRLESLDAPPISGEFEVPMLAVFANLDRNATDLSDLQESVGVYLQDGRNLRRLSRQLAGVVTSTHSEYLEAPYEGATVYQSLLKIEGHFDQV